MRIPHRELEKVRKNPTKYRGFSFNLGHGFSVYPTTSMFRLALMEYHKTKSIDSAISYFDTRFDSHRKKSKLNEKIKDEFINYLVSYHEEYSRLEISTFKAFAKIAIPINKDVIISGEILRIDIVSVGGYSAYILEKEERKWHAELRMPLIQGFLSNQLNCPSDEIGVGFYFYKPGIHSSYSYAPPKIQRAFVEALKIANILGE
jgi:hypothetical protein